VNESYKPALRIDQRIKNNTLLKNAKKKKKKKKNSNSYPLNATVSSAATTDRTHANKQSAINNPAAEKRRDEDCWKAAVQDDERQRSAASGVGHHGAWTTACAAACLPHTQHTSSRRAVDSIRVQRQRERESGQSMIFSEPAMLTWQRRVRSPCAAPLVAALSNVERCIEKLCEHIETNKIDDTLSI
jgi:hypothetical protein